MTPVLAGVARSINIVVENKMIQTKFIREMITYTGEQLRSHWIYHKTGLLGDAIVAFRGPAQVNQDHLVDLADVREGKYIQSKDMLHFLIEHFDSDLVRTILRQRLLISICAEKLNQHLDRFSVLRNGDDLYDEDKKLSVSIATLSPVSSLIHVGINIDSTGTPVPAMGLSDYSIDSEPFAEEVLDSYSQEIKGVEIARCKVRGVA